MSTLHQSFQQPHLRTLQTVKIYIRMPNSRSCKVVLPVQQSLLELKSLIQKQMNSQTDKQVLYYQGKEIKQDEIVRLRQKGIVHVKNSQDQMQDISVNFTKHMPQNGNIFKLNHQKESVKINPFLKVSTVLEECLKDMPEIDINQTKIIECGRLLKLHKTFYEQKVQGEADLNLILRKTIQKQNQQDAENSKFLLGQILRNTRKTSYDQRQSKLEESSQRAIKRSPLHQSMTLELEKGIPLNEDKQQGHSYSRQSLPNYFNQTKASELWQTRKVVKKEITPLKFSFMEYNKKPTGPKSVRECNCKKKDQFYIASDTSIKTQGDNSPQEPVCLLHSNGATLLRLKTKTSIT